MNYPLTNHSSFDIHAKSFNKINNNDSISKIQKNSNEFFVLNKKELNPLLKGKDLNKEYYKISPYKKEKNVEKVYNQEDNKNKVYNIDLNKGKNFNGKQNKLAIKNIFDNINNVEKKKDNYCYYESKYTKLVTDEKENNCINGISKEKYFNYPNENKNISNIQKDNISRCMIFDSNSGNKTEIYNSGLKKHQSELNNSKENNAKNQTVIISNNNSNKKSAIILKNNNNIKNAQTFINNNKYLSSKSIHIEALSEIYRSPTKKKIIENGYYNSHENNNNNSYNKNKLAKNVPSKSCEKININIKIENSLRKNDNNSRKKEMTSEQKLANY